MDVDRDTLRTAFLACYVATLEHPPKSWAAHPRQAEAKARRLGVPPAVARAVATMPEGDLRRLMAEPR